MMTYLPWLASMPPINAAPYPGSATSTVLAPLDTAISFELSAAAIVSQDNFTVHPMFPHGSDCLFNTDSDGVCLIQARHDNGLTREVQSCCRQLQCWKKDVEEKKQCVSRESIFHSRRFGFYAYFSNQFSASDAVCDFCCFSEP